MKPESKLCNPHYFINLLQNLVGGCVVSQILLKEFPAEETYIFMRRKSRNGSKIAFSILIRLNIKFHVYQSSK